MKFIDRFSFYFLISLLIWSCAPEDLSEENSTTPTEDEECLVSGDIVVSSFGNKGVFVFAADGTYKKSIANYLNGDAPYGLAFNESTNELIIAIDVSDRIEAIKTSDCSVRSFTDGANVTGNIRGVSVNSNGDILVVDTNQIEKFNNVGVRQTSGGYPATVLTATSQVSFDPTTGGFIVCSSTAGTGARKYTSSGVATGTAYTLASYSANGCTFLSDGRALIAVSGTNDALVIRNNDMTTPGGTTSFNIPEVSTPVGITQLSSGNILVVDSANGRVVEYSLGTSSATYVRTFGAPYLSTPQFVIEIP